jgi:3'5'-cyclic nucleotide phosphodiesterase
MTKFLSKLIEDDKIATRDDVTKQVRAVLADPLTQLALIFATLTMNVGHEGVSNEQLEKEFPELGNAYNHRAISEQHSIALIWELLMAPCFANLQQELFPTHGEFLFFRRVMVNSIMATFTDRTMSLVRADRWRKTFTATTASTSSGLATHERATLVMECLAQSASVAYALQHWPVYKKWSTRLFDEQYHAFLLYRSDTNPSVSWIEDQIVQFDTMIIPLAKRMANCGVFDPRAVNEHLLCAQSNRDELCSIGKQLVEEMVESVHQEMCHRQEI